MNFSTQSRQRRGVEFVAFGWVLWGHISLSLFFKAAYLPLRCDCSTTSRSLSSQIVGDFKEFDKDNLELPHFKADVPNFEHNNNLATNIWMVCVLICGSKN